VAHEADVYMANNTRLMNEKNLTTYRHSIGKMCTKCRSRWDTAWRKIIRDCKPSCAFLVSLCFIVGILVYGHCRC